MKNTKRRPVTVGQMLVTEFLEPMNIEITELAQAMGVHRNTLSRIVNDKGTLTAPMAIKLAAALGNTPEFWLNIQHAVELWDVRHNAWEREARDVKRVYPHTEGKVLLTDPQ
ncbi:HigA family addiction module antitoxin [Erwinia sp. V71]|uniref:HigA family addiction module antitoxin n=1 Tax=Erwinia sp. V71 TaxID=3369424 RepID=UPI003F6312DB